MGGYAWVTLATNNSYCLGALVLAHSLKRVNTVHKLAALITPTVSDIIRKQLEAVFDVVEEVNVLYSNDEEHLALMKRPELEVTFTKIHCWRFTQFEKCVFLDADTLVVRNCDELFEREEFSAAPDVGWPDCFNSGVFVFRPSVETYNELLCFAVEHGSFDGGDQGLLNQYFSDWATKDIKKHLPFVYNVTSVAIYSYIPALKHYGAEIRIVHFIGTNKPWMQQVDTATKTFLPTSGSEHLTPFFEQWWNLFWEKVYPDLDKNLEIVLESSNNRMSRSHVEACSNSLPVALIDESQTSRLIEPCTPYREKDDFRQYNLPYQPFDVKGSSGELLNEEFLLASVVSPTALEVSLDEQQRLDEDKMEEKNDESDRREEEIKKEDEVLESNICTNEKNYTVQKPEKTDEEKQPEGKIQDLEQHQKQEDPPPPKNPFEYNSFFPDDTCINNYLERNVQTYQPFDSHHHYYKHNQHKYEHVFESNNESDSRNDDEKTEQNIPFLPRFLTLPEDDRRQSGNIETHSLVRDYQHENQLLKEDFPPETHKHPPQKPIQSRDDIQIEPIAEKRELIKSKSMPYLPCDVTTTEPRPPPSQSIWKSQPNVNIDFNRKYSMPKLKPLLPKQNSFNKSSSSAIPKVTQYTEFLMSSEYKDPIDLPRDKIGFVEMHIQKGANTRRGKSDVDIPSRFGPLPYALSPEAKKPVIPKKIPFQHLENELYDLTQCKRQLGNKPKPKGTDQKKENIRTLPALKPIVPEKDIKSTAVKKRKSKKPPFGDGRREKILKRDPEIVKDRERVAKPTPRNVSVETDRNDLDEILSRLREFSKNYQHFFGVATETNKKAVNCKNATVQTSEQGNDECTSSEVFKTFSTPISKSSKESQTDGEISCGSAVESSEFREFRNYVKDRKEASEKGLLGLQDILSGSVEGKKEGLKLSSPESGKKDMENGIDSLREVKNGTKEANDTLKLAEEFKSLKILDDTRQKCSDCQSSSESNECSDKTHINHSMLKHVESSTSRNVSSNLISCTSSSGESKTVNLVHHANAISLNVSVLDESNELEANDIIEKTVQFPSESCDIIPSLTYRNKESPKTNETVPKRLEEQEKNEANIKEETNDLLNSKSSKEYYKNSKESFTKGSTENRSTSNIEEAVLEHPKVCQSLEEKFSVPSSDAIASKNLTKSKDLIEAQLRQEDVTCRKSGKEERGRENCKSGTSCDVKFTKSKIHSKNEEINCEGLVSIPGKKDGKNTEPRAESSIRRNKEGGRSLHAKGVTEAITPIISSFTALTIEQRSHKEANGNEKTGNEKCKKEKRNEKSKEGGGKKVVEEYKKSEDHLCEPDFGVPRSSSGTPSIPEVTASDSIEKKTTKTVHECADQSSSPALPQKSQSSPKKVSENGFKNQNRFSSPSNDSPDGPSRFIAKKTHDKKPKKKTPFPSVSSPPNGNAPSENVEDLRTASGAAGAFAQHSLLRIRDWPDFIAASIASEKYARLHNWETGNMDYMGKDSFDNIWSKICQTIGTKESEEPITGSPKTPEETSVTTEKTEKPKEVALAESAVSSNLQKCLECIETLPGEPAVGPIKDDEIFFSKPENKHSCLTNVAEEEEVEMESSASRSPLSARENVKLSDILHSEPSAGESENIQIRSSDIGKDVMTKEKSDKKEEKVEKESRNLPETLDALPKSTKPSASSAGEKSQVTALSTEINTQPSSPKKVECKTVAICQPPISVPQALPSDEQKVDGSVKVIKPEEKAGECKTVAIPSQPVFPGASFPEKEKGKSNTEKVEKPTDVKSEPIPLPPPESRVVASTQELGDKTSVSDSLKDESKQKKGVFTKILEIVGVAPKEKNGSEISKSVFYDTEGSAQAEADNQTSIMRETEEQTSTEKIETAQSAGDAQVIEADEPKVMATEREKAMPPAEGHKTELLPSEAEEKKTELIPASKESGEIQGTKLQESEQIDKSQGQKLPTKEIEKPSVADVNSKNQSKKSKSGQAKPARNSSPKEPKTPANSGKGSVAKKKSSSPKLTMPQNLPETEITMPTPPLQPDVSPKENPALLKVDDSILETPPVPETPEESIEAVKNKISKETDIIEKAKNEVESLLQDCRSARTEEGENSDLINTMKLMMGGEQPIKAGEEDIEELRVTSEEERKQHKGEVVSSKLSDQILKAIPPPRRKAISEASASTSAIPKAPEQKNPPGENKTKTSKSSSIPVPPPRSRGKPTQPAPSKGKGKK